MSHSNLGRADGKGRLDEAIAACREALRLQPDYAGARDNLGERCGSRGSWWKPSPAITRPSVSIRIC